VNKLRAMDILIHIYLHDTFDSSHSSIIYSRFSDIIIIIIIINSTFPSIDDKKSSLLGCFLLSEALAVVDVVDVPTPSLEHTIHFKVFE
jgi:hypothetical protein